jgi:5-methyltetrahydrofolate--homocysteine methyltransferase
MSEFLKALHSGKVLLMDGAMGTELQRAGIGEGECYELWNLTQPEKVRAIHRSYVDAGAECLLTNTFQANRLALAKHGIADKREEIHEAAVEAARSVTGEHHFVIGDVGPEWEGLCEDDVFQMVRSLRRADAILFETWTNIGAGLCFVMSAQVPTVNTHGIPILFSVTFQKNYVQGSPQYPEKPRKVASIVRDFDIDALGVNCGRDIDMDDIIHIVKQYRAETDLPIFVRPNAGTPKRVGNRWEYPLTPAMMAERLPELLEAGVSMVGGCCGTTPEHIAAFRPIIDAWNARK